MSLANDFPPQTYEDWRREAEKQVGARSEGKLARATLEKLTVRPIYVAADAEGSESATSLPDAPPFSRGTSHPKYKNSWLIAQQISYASCSEFNKALRRDLELGLGVINLPLDHASRDGKDPDMATARDVAEGGLSVALLQDLEKAIDGVFVTAKPLYIQAGVAGLAFLALLVALAGKNGEEAARLRGCVADDPLSELVASGALPVSLSQIYDEMAVTTAWAKRNAPNLKTIIVSSRPYHDSGADAIGELSFAAATGVEYLRQLRSRGLAIDDTAPRMHFELAIGPNLFMEIAKFRAARIIWSKIVSACGGNTLAQKMVIHARTSVRNKTIYDPYVNIIRATTEAFSAVAGGCQSLQTGSFDELLRTPDDFSRRIFQNTQTILREEAHLDQIIDPAGGSYYVEALTDSIARRSWDEFQEIERRGGMFKAIESGFVQNGVAEIAAARRERMATGRDLLVGINMYPNSSDRYGCRGRDENLVHKRIEEVRELRVAGRPGAESLTTVRLPLLLNDPGDTVRKLALAAAGGATIGEISTMLHQGAAAGPAVSPLEVLRLAADFERLRHAVEKHSQKAGISLEVYLANLGAGIEFGKSSDYAANFFGVAGFDIVIGPAVGGVDEVVRAFERTSAPAIAICPGKDENPDKLASVATALRKARPEVLIVLAQSPGENLKKLSQAGIDQFIYDGTDMIQGLTRVLNRLGVPI